MREFQEFVAVKRLFFILLSMRIATGRPIGPINAVNGSNDASCRGSIHIPYGFHNKNPHFPYFSPKNVKKCISPRGNFKQL